jgi:hypothetical protein
MKEFIQRNKPVFFIGLVTILVFAAIIITSQKQNTTQLPGLKKIESKDTGTTKVEDFFLEEPNDASQKTSDELTENTAESSEAIAEMDQKYGTLVIEFTKDGFTPRNTRAIKGQLVRWVNKTDMPIYIEQLLKYYPDWVEPKSIPAGGNIEFRLTVENYWTYREKETKSFGSIYVLPAPSQADDIDSNE